MREAHLMQPFVGTDHLVGDPGALLSGTPDGGALPDDLGERGIEPYFEQLLADSSLQAATHVEVGRPERHARIGRKPEEGRAGIVGPGKDALGVGGKHTLRIQVTAIGDETFGIGLAGIRKGILACKVVCRHCVPALAAARAASL